jgi:hypothetical protein
MSVSCNQQVFRFQVTICNFLAMQVLKGEHDFCNVEQRDIVWKQILASEQAEDLTPLHVLKCQIHMCIVLETLVPIKSQLRRPLTSSR